MTPNPHILAPLANTKFHQTKVKQKWRYSPLPSQLYIMHAVVKDVQEHVNGWEIDQTSPFGQHIATSWAKDGMGVGQNGMRATNYGLGYNALEKSKCNLILTLPVISLPKYMSSYRERRTNVVFSHRCTCLVELKPKITKRP